MAAVHPENTVTAEYQWHGWKRPSMGDKALHIGEFPGRKSKTLYIQDGTRLAPVAYFRDEEMAEVTSRLLDNLIFGSEG